MERTRYPEIVSPYDIQYEPIVLSKPLLDLLLSEDNPADLIGLYSFYYYTAKWQKTNQPRATVDYIARGIKWSEEKVRKTKKVLKDLRLIEDVQERGLGNKILSHFVKVNFIWKTPHVERSQRIRPPSLTSQSVESSETNALSTLKILFPPIVESEPPLSLKNPITPSKFEEFWKTYPRKIDKGKAKTAWDKLCQKKTKDRITWEEIKTAIHDQKRSDRWQDSSQIPHPTTWLNQSRWMDDPSKMSRYVDTTGMRKFIIDDGIKYTLGTDGRYRNAAGSIYIE